MLLFFDHSSINTDLAAGALSCPRRGCGGRLGPWGWARIRAVRMAPGHVERHRPRRGRCRLCRRTHVLAPLLAYPRRADSIETVGAALLAAVAGLGHRHVAAQVGVPATTVRGWLRRATANADAVRATATVKLHDLDPMAAPLRPTGSALGDMVDAVGRAVAAWALRIGPPAAPWQLAAALTRGGILAPPPPRVGSAE